MTKNISIYLLALFYLHVIKSPYVNTLKELHPIFSETIKTFDVLLSDKNLHFWALLNPPYTKTSAECLHRLSKFRVNICWCCKYLNKVLLFCTLYFFFLPKVEFAHILSYSKHHDEKPCRCSLKMNWTKCSPLHRPLVHVSR